MAKVKGFRSIAYQKKTIAANSGNKRNWPYKAITKKNKHQLFFPLAKLELSYACFLLLEGLDW